MSRRGCACFLTNPRKQLARSMGCQVVIATCGAQDREAALANGAHYAIDYRAPDIVEQVPVPVNV
jgi:NADPH:quinone reductase-like Zn-dependent oxidoreductase